MFERPLRALIAPHAGMVYSGETASYAYAVLRRFLYNPTLQGDLVRRVFILGPAHVKGFAGVEISSATEFETPFGPLPVDTQVTSKLLNDLKKGGVTANWASKEVDTREHSIELQTPYLSHILYFPPGDQPAAKDRIKIVPLVIGDANQNCEKRIYEILEPYMSSKENVFIYSSDFCHWGSRFRYTYHYKKERYPLIGDAIIAMDKEGMTTLEKVDLTAWYQYLDATDNTICGRHAIGVGLQGWHLQKKHTVIDFLRYSQSNKCASPSDSSVSYASAVITEK
ncbi:memo-like protein [Angomonas deanei]|nr:memo-like protein [Angomonas deanei]|eukprot:EPY41783.1 memo-like protein [Angomonas deanei]